MQIALLGILIQADFPSWLNQPPNRVRGLTSIERARFYLCPLHLARCLCTVQVYSSMHSTLDALWLRSYCQKAILKCKLHYLGRDKNMPEVVLRA